MRDGILAILIAGLMVAAIGFFASRTTGRIVAAYEKETTAVLQAVRQGENERAAALAKAMKINWEKDCRRLKTIVMHEDAERVEEAIRRLLAGFETDDRGIVLSAVYLLEESLDDIAQREVISWANII